MPADFELIPGTRTVYSRGWGALTDADLLGHMARISALFKAGTLDTEWAQLWDFTGVENVDGVLDRRHSTGRGRQSLAALRRPRLHRDHRRAVRPGPHVPGLGRSEDRRHGHRRSVADADAFIARERLRLGIGI